VHENSEEDVHTQAAFQQLIHRTEQRCMELRGCHQWQESRSGNVHVNSAIDKSNQKVMLHAAADIFRGMDRGSFTMRCGLTVFVHTTEERLAHAFRAIPGAVFVGSLLQQPLLEACHQQSCLSRHIGVFCFVFTVPSVTPPILSLTSAGLTPGQSPRGGGGGGAHTQQQNNPRGQKTLPCCWLTKKHLTRIIVKQDAGIKPHTRKV